MRVVGMRCVGLLGFGVVGVVVGCLGVLADLPACTVIVKAGEFACASPFAAVPTALTSPRLTGLKVPADSLVEGCDTGPR